MKYYIINYVSSDNIRGCIICREGPNLPCYWFYELPRMLNIKKIISEGFIGKWFNDRPKVCNQLLYPLFPLYSDEELLTVLSLFHCRSYISGRSWKFSIKQVYEILYN